MPWSRQRAVASATVSTPLEVDVVVVGDVVVDTVEVVLLVGELVAMLVGAAVGSPVGPKDVVVEDGPLVGADVGVAACDGRPIPGLVICWPGPELVGDAVGRPAVRSPERLAASSVVPGVRNAVRLVGLALGAVAPTAASPPEVHRLPVMPAVQAADSTASGTRADAFCPGLNRVTLVCTTGGRPAIRRPPGGVDVVRRAPGSALRAPPVVALRAPPGPVALRLPGALGAAGAAGAVRALDVEPGRVAA